MISPKSVDVLRKNKHHYINCREQRTNLGGIL